MCYSRVQMLRAFVVVLVVAAAGVFVAAVVVVCSGLSGAFVFTASEQAEARPCRDGAYWQSHPHD